MENKTVLGILVVCLTISLIITGVMVSNIQVDAPEVDLSSAVTAEQVNAIVQSAVAGIVIPEAVVESGEDSESLPAYSNDFVLSKSEYEDEVEEAEALRLAIESVESRDFKKAVFDALVSYDVDIESYKDITEIQNVNDADVDKDEVKFDLKVYYFIEGDEDEVYKSRLEGFTVTVDDLDFDEEFEDAEVDENYMGSLVVKYSREA